MVLHLQPAALGRVEVQLQVQDNRLQIVFRAESAEAEQALRESADELVQAVLHRGEGRWHTVDVRVDRPDGQRSQDGEPDEGEPQERGREEDGPGRDGQRRDRRDDRRREDGATA